MTSPRALGPPQAVALTILHSKLATCEFPFWVDLRMFGPPFSLKMNASVTAQHTKLARLVPLLLALKVNVSSLPRPSAQISIFFGFWNAGILKDFFLRCSQVIAKSRPCSDLFSGHS